MKTCFWGTFLCVFLSFVAYGNGDGRWKIEKNGSLIWKADKDIPHFDHVEMSGESVSAVLRYGVNSNGSFHLERSVIWPMLRTIPNNTHASLTKRFAVDFLSLLMVNDIPLKNETVKSVQLDGTLTVVSEFALLYKDVNREEKRIPWVEVTRKFFPSVKNPMLCEQYWLKNISDRPLSVMIPVFRNVYRTDPDAGVDGSYTLVAGSDSAATRTLAPGEETGFNVTIQAYSERKGEQELVPSVNTERALREKFVQEMWNNLVLETPEKVIDREFAFSKIRVAESIYRTAGGLMHGPGGEAYYAAIWANDEAEYVAPFFPFLGYQIGNEATMNTFRLYMKYMNKEYKPVPSSIIAEGKDIWQGAGDCGDAAMLAYGGIRFALAQGNMETAKYLWPLMEWCLEYCNRKLNQSGVVESDADELEGRFPSGKANLLVSSLYYDALVSATFLGKELGLPENRRLEYKQQAALLKNSIESYFGATVEGYNTYRYYKDNTVLRSWICTPLFAGIMDRAKPTIDALFSCLWTKNGLLSQSGSDSYWDRSTLCALRAVYVAGDADRATRYLKEYSIQRLLGDHVPYPIEAWPEGDQRHLSGESGLYCRVITEGLFGIRPSGLRSFFLSPRLPENWDHMTLRHVKAFGNDFDIYVNRSDKHIRVIIKIGGKIFKQVEMKNGNTISVNLGK